MLYLTLSLPISLLHRCSNSMDRLPAEEGKKIIKKKLQNTDIRGLWEGKQRERDREGKQVNANKKQELALIKSVHSRQRRRCWWWKKVSSLPRRHQTPKPISIVREQCMSPELSSINNLKNSNPTQDCQRTKNKNAGRRRRTENKNAGSNQPSLPSNRIQEFAKIIPTNLKIETHQI